MNRRIGIEISGIVQGVGFRPYVYRLATERRLAGYVTNTAAGVSIEVQGPAEAVDDFVVRLPREIPPLARVTTCEVRELSCNGDTEFRIVASRAGQQMRTLISPDVAICADCLREMLDPQDRRYRYPFINCTNCGPRYTIVRDLPYDRPRTSMGVFRMCPACQAEYDDPANRRFHAQPNACWDCGPLLELWDCGGHRLEVKDPVCAAIEHLRTGATVAIKGLGGFHLAVDATNPTAVEHLRRNKRRVEKPFAVMAPNIGAIAGYCELDEESRKLIESIQRPIVLLPKREPSPIADAVAPHNRYLGVFLPYTPLHYLIFSEGQFAALVMTSGNVSEEPIAIANQEAVSRLGPLADYLLVHNRDILLRCDDSVARVAGGRPRQMRRSRGFVPVPVFLREELPPILAVGGELKNTLCVTKGSHAFLSQHVGDLENVEGYRFFEEVVEHLQRILEIKPQIIAYDLHPDYFSTRWALAQTGVRPIGVQHHHAHIAACMAENQLEGRVIGFALDGTGYGTDARIWGGEVMVADYLDFRRAAHFAYVPLPGGAAAIREPWRMAVAYLAQHFGRDFLDQPISLVDQIERRHVDVVLRMIERGVNCPLTSSCGRLFDAVAALIGIRHRVNYEAQAAIELEMAIEHDDNEPPYSFEVAQQLANGERRYPFEVAPRPAGDDLPYSFEVAQRRGAGSPGRSGAEPWVNSPEQQSRFSDAAEFSQAPWVIGTRPLFEALLRDLREGVSTSTMSQRFHNGLVEVFATIAGRLRKREQLNRVCLSGGSFQNLYLFEHLVRRLRQDGFEVFTHSEVPAGDGGLSLGQALVAAYRAR